MFFYHVLHFFFFRYFDCIDICKVRVGWHEVRLTGILPPLASTRHLSCLLLTVLQPTEADFTLFQEGQRYVAFSVIFIFIICMDLLFNFIFLNDNRSSAKAQRSQLDLCVVVFRARAGAAPHPGRLVAHSKRQVNIQM